MALNGNEGGGYTTFNTLKRAGVARPAPTPISWQGQAAANKLAMGKKPPQTETPQPTQPTTPPPNITPGALPGGAKLPPPNIAPQAPGSGITQMQPPPMTPGGFGSTGGVTQMQPPPMYPGGFGTLPQAMPGMGGGPNIPPPPPPQQPHDVEGQLYRNWAGSQPGTFNPQGGADGGYSNPLDPQIQQTIAGQLANPSRYDMPMVKNSFDMLNRQLSEGYNTQAQQVDEEMARRGLYNSTTAGGRLGDLRTNQARAQADMAQNLLMDQARTYSGDLNAATSAGLGYGQYGQSEAQRRFGNQAQTYGMNADQNQRNWQNYTGYGQQAFDNQMATGRFNQDQDVINNQLLMQLLGGL